MDHSFKMEAMWKGGLNGEGRIHSGNLEVPISVPKELRGPGIGTNPEELLLSSAGACYLITLAAILERRSLKVERVDLISSGTVQFDKGLRFTSITHRPTFHPLPDSDKKALHDAADQAEKACMVSNAIRGNVAVNVEVSFSE